MFGPFAALRSLLVPLAVLGLAALAPAAAETQPPGGGDIPDTQAFVRYASPQGYSLLVPEGWSRTVHGASARFSAHYDGLEIVLRARSAPSAAVRGIAPHMSAVRSSVVRVGDTPMTRLSFGSDSQPDPVTAKTIRLDDEAYVFVRGKRAAVLHLWAPHGADNADQWQKIARSFRWR